jgi:hypothetical protein
MIISNNISQNFGRISEMQILAIPIITEQKYGLVGSILKVMLISLRTGENPNTGVSLVVVNRVYSWAVFLSYMEKKKSSECGCETDQKKNTRSGM